ncbi:hypothetical protein KI387_043745 [Taxus chinensis]|uniref:Uncharacterized protein n=1 Tax=Taxus chinensis TaxID=29808 RepID=A0AA38GRP7_TAXCH|nr:hypothetical protein KI387_043745 [Taxus chinensis]
MRVWVEMWGDLRRSGKSKENGKDELGLGESEERMRVMRMNEARMKNQDMKRMGRNGMKDDGSRRRKWGKRT